MLQYSVSELANNVIQHARAPGFATAQYMARTDIIRVAMADTGIGVLRSFAENNSPFWKPEMTEAEAIALALQPKVSSKLHLTTAWGESINAGVGLTLLKEFCSLAGGCFFMASGNGVCFQLAGDKSFNQNSLRGNFHGTVCALSFNRATIRNFPELLHKAKQSVSLLPTGEEFGKYFT